MNKNSALAARLQEVLLDGKWIANTNFKDQLSEITYTQALQKVENLNTIALLTFHVNYYLKGILQVLEGGNLEIRDKFSFDMPEIRSEDDWIILVHEFIANSEKFVEVVMQMPDSRLDEVFVDQKYGSYSRNIEGMIEHGYYHLGQIALLAKLTSQG